MRKWFQKWHRSVEQSRFFVGGLAGKYLVRFGLLIVIPVLVLFIIMYAGCSRVLFQTVSAQKIESISQLSAMIGSEIDRIALSSAIVSRNQELLEWIQQWKENNNAYERLQLRRKIDDKLSFLFDSIDMRGALFFCPGGGYYEYKQELAVKENEIRSSPTYQNMIRHPGLLSLSVQKDILRGGSDNVFSVWVSLEKKPGRQFHTELIYFSFEIYAFRNLLASLDYLQESEIYFVDEEGDVVLSSRERAPQKNYLEVGLTEKIFHTTNGSYLEKMNGKRSFITVGNVERTRWKIVCVTDEASVMQNINRVLALTLFVFLLLIAAFLIFSVMFFDRLIKPLNALMDHIQLVQEGELDAEVPLQKGEELYALSSSFNGMLNRIKNLMKERDEHERAKNYAMIEVLQMQINPHFAINTLSAIRLMAMISHNDNIKSMVEAFMDILSSTLGFADEMVTLDSEMKLLNRYIYIMQVRYGGKFQVEFEVAPETRECYLLRMMLQPIIENAILHGFPPDANQGKITVRTTLWDKNLLLEVEDNGKGIEPQTLEGLLHGTDIRKRNLSGIGINNVNHRIQLNFGASYGLSIQSQMEKGTCVSILVPVIKDLEAWKNENSKEKTPT